MGRQAIQGKGLRVGTAKGVEALRIFSIGKKTGNADDPLCEGSRFVGEKHVHTSRRFDADRLSHQNHVPHHFLDVGGENYCNHEWKSFRDGDDDNGEP